MYSKICMSHLKWMSLQATVCRRTHSYQQITSNMMEIVCVCNISSCACKKLLYVLLHSATTATVILSMHSATMCNYYTYYIAQLLYAL